MSMDVFVLGTGGSMPLPGRSLTSVLLRREGELFLFDCGEGTQVSLRALNLKWKKINAIFISHTHADHITGLPGMLMLSSQVNRDEPLYVVGPPRTREFVETNRSVLEMYINFEIIVQELDIDKLNQVVWETDEYIIRSFPLKHSRVCVGYTLEEKQRPGTFLPERAEELGVPCGPLWAQLQHGYDVTLPDGSIVEPHQVLGKQRRGRKFSYVTDSLPIDSIVNEVYNSDLFVCEGMFADDCQDTAHEKRHMTARQAARLATQAGRIKQMGLIHFSPRYTNGQLKHLAMEAQSLFPDAFCLRDRMKISIPYDDEVIDT